MFAGFLGGLLSLGCAADIGSEEDPDLDITYINDDLEPVIWFHGCPPPFVNAEFVSHFTDAQRQYFLDRGYTEDLLFRFVFQGPQCGSNIDYAYQIAAKVNEVRAATGAEKVTIVGHSMGALATRLYLAWGGTQYVRNHISIGGGNHGSDAAAIWPDAQQQFGGPPAYVGLQEMYPPYACAGQTAGGAADVQLWVNGCLTPTGRTVSQDETPGNVRYISIWNTVDEQVLPREAACINMKKQNDCSSGPNRMVTVGPGPGPCGPTGCPGHVTMLWDPGVMNKVYEHVRSGGH